MRAWQLPQPVPAPVASATASIVVAPLSIAAFTWLFVTARQIHVNTVLSSPLSSPMVRLT